MKIVIASYTFLPDIGGVASTEANLAEAFAVAGHDVTVLTLTDSVVSDYYPYKVIRRPSVLELVRHYRSSDLILASNLSLKLLFPFLFLRKRFGLRHHSESAWNLSRSWLSSDHIRRVLLRRAKHYMTSAYCGHNSGLPFVVTHPSANKMFTEAGDIGSAATRSGILFVGRLVEEKGLDLLVSQAKHICSALGETTIHVIGDGLLRPSLEKTLQSDPDLPVILEGSRSLQETADAMARAAYVLVPSLWNEPFGAVALEALAAGAIVIHSGRGGLSEATGGFAHVFDPDDIATLTSALESARTRRHQLLESPENWSKLRQEVKRWLSNFSAERTVQTIIVSYEK
ncbi:glycosyltransferase family 4 protein [Agrobacterium cavarae]|uniref:glycosyltransferase family 4 protein n=1 Tax=Agrobacterium cavarae TaxID=2528239 RepID=UPI0028ACCA4D|nr:glycosyltransferase family 4 protein [Agrobacterium cavarae]